MNPATPLPPLVEPAVELSATEIERYSRHLLVPEIGMLGQRRLKNARVLVVGAGGLGSPALSYLAAAGVGTIGVIDPDVVELSNLQRQVIHRTDAIGRPKVESAAEAVAGINPLVTLVQHPVRITAANAAELIAGYDLVLDGTDNFPTRYLVNDACVLAGKPYVWGSILRFEGQVSVFWAEHGPHYRDVYPHPPPEGSVPSCAQAGVLGALCATIGSLMVTEAVKLICGIGQTLVGRLLIYDAVDLTFRTVRVRRDPSASAVTALPDDAGAAGAASPFGTAVAASGRDGPDAVDPGVAAARADDDLAAHTIGPAELKRRMESGEDVLLVDVREPGEREIASIAGSVPIGQDQIVSGAALDRLPRDRRIVLHCRSGGRSAQALRVLHAAGFADAEHLGGGILAWIDDIEPALPRY